MGFEHEGPGGANFGDHSCGQPVVRWEDAAEVRRWFEALKDAVKDLRGAARDRVRPRRQRIICPMRRWQRTAALGPCLLQYPPRCPHRLQALDILPARG